MRTRQLGCIAPDVHWLYKRAQVVARYLGAATEHRATVARLLRAQVAFEEVTTA